MNPWEMMGQAPQPQQQMTVWDYPGVREAIGIPQQPVPPLPMQGEPQQPQMSSPWADLMETGYGTYL